MPSRVAGSLVRSLWSAATTEDQSQILLFDSVRDFEDYAVRSHRMMSALALLAP
jgi:hypothetical protein